LAPEGKERYCSLTVWNPCRQTRLISSRFDLGFLHILFWPPYGIGSDNAAKRRIGLFLPGKSASTHRRTTILRVVHRGVENSLETLSAAVLLAHRIKEAAMSHFSRSILLTASLLVLPLAGAVAQAVVDQTGTGKSTGSSSASMGSESRSDGDTMKSTAPGYESKSGVAGGVGQSTTNAATGETGKTPGVAPGVAAADASKIEPRGTKVAPSTETSAEAHSTATARPPGVPEGPTAAQLPRNTSEAKSQPRADRD
jgi:hypothetical protein